MDATSDPTAITTPPTAVATALDPGVGRRFRPGCGRRLRRRPRLDDYRRVPHSTEQQALFDAEVEERGSVEEAARWVFPPDRSMHVRGLAIDVGDGPAAHWLAAEGYRFGLCQTLDWEWWHFEWRPSGRRPATARLRRPTPERPDRRGRPTPSVLDLAGVPGHESDLWRRGVIGENRAWCCAR